jgi:hypothetical protein
MILTVFEREALSDIILAPLANGTSLKNVLIVYKIRNALSKDLPPQPVMPTDSAMAARPELKREYLSLIDERSRVELETEFTDEMISNIRFRLLNFDGYRIGNVESLEKAVSLAAKFGITE